MAKATIRETDLYAPVKDFLSGQGYEVKAEVCDADIVAVRGDEPPVIIELKTGFTLALLHQAIARQAITDDVYVAVPHGSGRVFQQNLKNNLSLCRRLGLGLLTVRLRDGFVDARLDPAPFTPRKSAVRQTRLLREFARRVGDPNVGGSTRTTLMTAYRQDAIRCLAHLRAEGPTKASLVASATGVPNARQIMHDDHYGWFERAERGVYRSSPRGDDVDVAFAVAA